MDPTSTPSEAPPEIGPRGTPEQLAAPIRRCKICGEVKPIEDYYFRSPAARARNSSEASARDRRCKECHKRLAVINGKKYRAKYPDRRLARFRQWKYGLTADAFEELWTTQDGRCAVCRAVFDRNDTKAIHIDHDHVHGTIRGLLCPMCNLGLGSLRDDPVILRAAITYLTQPLS